MRAYLQGTSVVRVSWYNTSKSKYETYVVGFSSTDMQLRNDYAYFVDCSDNSSLLLYGATIAGPHAITLNPGWNAVGWSSLITLKASDLCNQSAAIQRICQYNSTSRIYDTYVAGFSGADKNFIIKPGTGYFIYLNSATTLQLNEGVIP